MRLALVLTAALLAAAPLAFADGVAGRTIDRGVRGPGPAASPLTPAEISAGERRTDARPALTQASPAGYEWGIYRFGGTYSVIGSTSPAACEASCGADASCTAWSFVDTYGTAEARCELKRGAGRAEENNLAVSGLSPSFVASYTGMGEAAPEPVILDGGPDAPLAGFSAPPASDVGAASAADAAAQAGKTPAGLALLGADPVISYTPVAPLP